KLAATDVPTNPDRMINGKSTLVTVALGGAGNFGTKLDPSPPDAITFSDVAGADTAVTGFNAADFAPVFAANSSLDNVEIFNLLLIPGSTDTAVASEALSSAERKRPFAILAPPPQAPASGASTDHPVPIQYWMTGLDGSNYILPTDQNGAIYFPYLVS